MLEKLLKLLEGKVVVEQSPRLEGRNMTMLLAPKPGAFPKKEKTQAADKEKAREEDAKLPGEDDEDDDEVEDEASASEEARAT
jgi:hypothetical protein